MRSLVSRLFIAGTILSGLTSSASPLAAQGPATVDSQTPRRSSPHVLFLQGTSARIGWFDQFGDFIPDHSQTHQPMSGMPDFMLSHINGYADNHPAYEHRSGL